MWVGTSYRSTLSWKAEEGVWAISVSHGLQHRQQLHSMGGLAGKQTEREGGQGSSQHEYHTTILMLRWSGWNALHGRLNVQTCSHRHSAFHILALLTKKHRQLKFQKMNSFSCFSGFSKTAPHNLLMTLHWKQLIQILAFTQKHTSLNFKWMQSRGVSLCRIWEMLILSWCRGDLETRGTQRWCDTVLSHADYTHWSRRCCCCSGLVTFTSPAWDTPPAYWPSSWDHRHQCICSTEHTQQCATPNECSETGFYSKLNTRFKFHIIPSTLHPNFKACDFLWPYLNWLWLTANAR